MSYINLTTLEKVEAADIMLANPTVSFPNRGWSDEELEPYGFAILAIPATHPIPGPYEKLVETTPAKIDGQWFLQWEAVPMTESEIAVKDAETASSILAQTQARLDNFARTRNYDGILSLCTYATSTNAKFQAEGQYGVTARDDTWAKLYEIMGEVEAGTRPMPVGFKDIEPELPILQWPLEVIA